MRPVLRRPVLHHILQYVSALSPQCVIDSIVLSCRSILRPQTCNGWHPRHSLSSFRQMACLLSSLRTVRENRSHQGATTVLPLGGIPCQQCEPNCLHVDGLPSQSME